MAQTKRIFKINVKHLSEEEQKEHINQLIQSFKTQTPLPENFVFPELPSQDIDYPKDFSK